ncbi:rod shape-determining protein MreC [Flavobacteriaceae bacterium]|jgi:rod shape-determining protein MreC|nr:rod shape-determining protein MreC [Flavobacteriaceae bacterium]MDB3913406.1 rod shape-determining protein MreC [Flavobacteriaceae bacterium]MDB4495915.1 rod shape-determining protein MreC [Flavobacteriaceae bacterium]MDB4560110.1 rod shape-determining protein MreC [Flavobacteriaceae bacterium]MDC0652028.1 rod shape-determining protein MreC [Flavobacteriaceae bacterium]
MQQLIYFIQKYRYFLFFLFLELIAFQLIINNLNFHNSKFINSASSITGDFYKKTNSIRDYFQLDIENKELLNENLILKNKLERLSQKIDTVAVTKIFEKTNASQRYSYLQGRIEKNQFRNNYNFLTINLGKKDSITPEMGVINSKGILGIVENVLHRYSRVRSILNKSSKINAKLKNSNYFGTLTWDGFDYNITQLLDIPRQAKLKVGDTIITGGMSSIFPEGIPIGSIDTIVNGVSIKRVINIKLFNDMSSLKNIYVVKDFDKQQLMNLEKTENE